MFARADGLRRCLAQAAGLGRTTAGQPADDLDGPALVHAEADQFPGRVVDRPVTAAAVFGDGEGVHERGMKPPLCSWIARS